MQKDIQDLLRFIQHSPSPYHTVATAAELLQESGFIQLDMTQPWKISRGKSYFVSVYHSTLLAFTAGTKEGQLRISAAHTDFPCFRIKPQPVIKKERYGMINIEKYGGMILRTWLDRPLTLAGKVVLRTSQAFSPNVLLVDFARPLLTIPSLAIHMDREVNDEGKLNPQTDMLPLAVTGTEELSESFFLEWLAKEMDTRPEDILSYELSACPAEEGCLCGLESEFISSPRLDNLTSVLSCLNGMIAVNPEECCGIRMTALFDNEEVGSNTKQGADSAVLMQTLERIYRALGNTREELWSDIASGLLLSVDVAHAMHPNFTDKCDPSHKPVLGGGVVLKQSASQSYAGDAEAVAIVRGLCEAQEIPWQFFVNRNDIRGGSTLGSLASALVPMRTMDIGVPLLAMHSARELMHVSDQNALNRLLTAFSTL